MKRDTEEAGTRKCRAVARKLLVLATIRK